MSCAEHNAPIPCTDSLDSLDSTPQLPEYLHVVGRSNYSDNESTEEDDSALVRSWVRFVDHINEWNHGATGAFRYLSAQIAFPERNIYLHCCLA